MVDTHLKSKISDHILKKIRSGLDKINATEVLGIPQYPSDSNAPSNTVYFHTGDQKYKFKEEDDEENITIYDLTGALDTPSYITKGGESSLPNSVQHSDLSGADLHSPASHAIGSSVHGSSTLSDLNAKVSDATLDDQSAARPPQSHNISSHADGGSANPVSGKTHFQQLATTNSTFFIGNVGSDFSIFSGSWERPSLTVVYDERGEYATSGDDFVPDQDGWYRVTISYGYTGGSDQDKVMVRLNDSTAATEVFRASSHMSGTATVVVSASKEVELTGGNTYHFEGQNANSSDTIDGDSTHSFVTVRRVNV